MAPMCILIFSVLDRMACSPNTCKVQVDGIASPQTRKTSLRALRSLSAVVKARNAVGIYEEEDFKHIAASKS